MAAKRLGWTILQRCSMIRTVAGRRHFFCLLTTPQPLMTDCCRANLPSRRQALTLQCNPKRLSGIIQPSELPHRISGARIHKRSQGILT